MQQEPRPKPTPLARLGRLAVRRSRAVLLTALLLFLGLGVYGAGAQAGLDLARWDAPGTESVEAARVLREDFSTGNPNLALLVTARGGDIDDPATARAARALAAEVAALPHVTHAQAYWDGGSPALRSNAGSRGLILARLEGSATDTRALLAVLSPLLSRTTPELTVQVGGQEEISRQVGEQARTDFLTAEALVLPAVLLLLILVHRRTAAALITVGTGLLSVVGTLAGLRLLAQVTPVSTFSANIALVLGLGLGIDYSLFLITRYREERAAELARLPGVFRVEPPTYGRSGAALLAVVPTQQAMYGDVPAFVERIRTTDGPPGVLVGGYPAETADFRTTLLDRLPLVIGLVLAATFVILFLLTGSLLLPAKATVLNLLSLSVMFGCLVYVFQDGHFASLLGFTPTGSIEPSIPVLMFCVVYGLSMDYEVFMLARIKEEYERTGDTERAVVAGIRRSAPLITAAAGILALSFAAYATGGVVFLKELGVGTALAVLVDATLIRVVLLPVAMRLAGRANWWAPGPLRRLHRLFGLSEEPRSPRSSRTPEGVLQREYV
ncbi:MMPL family transporter [Streptomyces sp. ISL-36]|uniref:MMPL family transporter n=1 Tax=Streptomyces sp. ISL-36 TaxID=2819182 RepID=UPI0020354B73|nr:MMPL family transporter [Streptomyces sp. ISL-36]